MTISEIFPNPTVKQVIFQIRFPNLFYVENKIGDYQLKIMTQFPESELKTRRNVLMASFPSGVELKDLKLEPESFEVQKIWSFTSQTGVSLSVQSASLDISSTSHKTYRNQAANERFRDLIEFSVGAFLEVTAIPIISRVGLRYIDECPLPAKDNTTYQSYYNSTFPLQRYDVSGAEMMDFRTRIRRGEHFLQFREYLEQNKGEAPKLILDFDGFASNVKPDDYLSVTDALYEMISSEWQGIIKEPVYRYMRGEKND